MRDDYCGYQGHHPERITPYEQHVRARFAPLFAAAYRPKHRADVDEPDTYPTVAAAARAESHVGRHRKGLVIVK